MKRVILLIALLISTTAAYSQNIAEEDVPSPVKDNLYANFKAADVTWEFEDGIYEAEYLVNGMEKSIKLNPAGEVVAIETQIDPASLPAGVSSYLESNYPGAEITEAETIEINHVIMYGVEIRYNGNTMQLAFDENGNLLWSKNPGDSGDDND